MIDFSKYMTSEVLLSKFSTSLMRYQVENIANGKDKCWTDYTFVDYEGDYSPEDMIQWLQSLDKTKDWIIENRNETEFHAVSKHEVPYTEMQVASAIVWLRDHPKPEVEHVTWRRHVPFNVEFKESYED